MLSLLSILKNVKNEERENKVKCLRICPEEFALLEEKAEWIK